MERLYLVIKEWGHIPDELAGLCIKSPISSAEYPCLAKLMQQHCSTLGPVWIAQLLDQACSFSSVRGFPACVEDKPGVTQIQTGLGVCQACIDCYDGYMTVLTVTCLKAEGTISGFVTVWCLPYGVGDQIGTGIDLPVQDASKLCQKPLTWGIEAGSVALVMFTDVFGRHNSMEG